MFIVHCWVSERNRTTIGGIMKKILLCGHTGSANRGCEAIIKATADILSTDNNRILLATYRKDQDVLLGVDEFADVIEYRQPKIHDVDYLIAGVKKRIWKKDAFMHSVIQRDVLNAAHESVILNVGGDTYCYGPPREVMYTNHYAYVNKIPSILWSCSIGLENLTNEVIKDMKKYSIIMPRETKTYNNLVQSGISEDKLQLIADPAFVLTPTAVDLPFGFEQSNILGINVSPITVRGDTQSALIRENMDNLIDWVLNNTSMNILLIPHVYNELDLDITALKQSTVKYNDNHRVLLLDKQYSCRQIKYIISKCKFLIAARTHASIAAYSSYIPTLVLGYSIKSEGIADDIFGEHEPYVLKIEDINNEYDILIAFKLIMANEENIVEKLKKSMLVLGERLKKASKTIQEISI